MDLLRKLAAAAFVLAALPAHAVGRLADLHVVDRLTGQTMPVHWHEGRAYVVGRPGAEYEVVVRSRMGEDLLAVVSVDGVNVVSGETASVRQSGYVLDPWRGVRIRGWRKSLEETASFYFTSLGDSYASRTGRPANVGVIGVALFQRARRSTLMPAEVAAPSAAAKDEREAQPAAPSAQKRSATAPAAAAPLGTGHGRRESSLVHEVAFERASDEPAETIAIYYDSYRNLVAQGVLPAPATPRDPSPFPTRFVPDPPR